MKLLKTWRESVNMVDGLTVFVRFLEAEILDRDRHAEQHHKLLDDVPGSNACVAVPTQECGSTTCEAVKRGATKHNGARSL